jgi:Ca2+-binding RTX toxin-like protein
MTILTTSDSFTYSSVGQFPGEWPYGATLWFYVGASDLISIDGNTEAVYKNPILSFPTDAGLRVKLIGVDFRYNGATAIAGTLTGIDLIDRAGVILSHVGLGSGLPLTAFLDSTDKASLIFSGNDLMIGGASNDYLAGYGGSDSISGGGGNDYLAPGSGRGGSYVISQADTVDGGSGIDTVVLDYKGTTAGVALTFLTQQTDAGQTLPGGALLRNIENIEFYGGSGNDRLLGNIGDDMLVGGAGEDALSGGSGNDTLVGDEGADSLSGGAGDDVLVGTSLLFGITPTPGGATLSADTLDGGTGYDKALIAISEMQTSAMNLNFKDLIL